MKQPQLVREYVFDQLVGCDDYDSILIIRMVIMAMTDYDD